MKKKIICLLLAALYCSGCSNEYIDTVLIKENTNTLAHFETTARPYNKGHYPITITNINSKGEEAKQIFSKPPERVVAVWQNSIETLLALGVGDRIIAGNGVPSAKYFRQEYCEEYNKIPYTGLQLLDLESTMMLEPDFIVGWHSTFTDKVLRGTDFWHKRGVNTYIAEDSVANNRKKTLQSEYNDILNLGRIFDKEDRAKKIVGQMQQEIGFVQNKTNNAVEHPRGLIIESLGKDITVYGKRSLAGDILLSLNGELLAAEESKLSFEQIVDLNPDVIFLVVIESNYGSEQEIIERLTNNQALRHLRCVQEGKIIPLPLYAIYSSGIRTYDGIKIIAAGLYPELYKEKL